MKRNQRWEIVGKLKAQKLDPTSSSKLKTEEIIKLLLENRGIKTKKDKEEFLNPTRPEDLKLKDLEINENSVNKALERIEKAIKDDEQIVIYGDYDADGICATAILWENLYSLNKKTLPYIPDRFSEGYGLNAEAILQLKTHNSKLALIITVDNGIVASNAIDIANELGIDVIITDHHQVGKELPKAYSVIHTDKIGGAGIAWILARELLKKLEIRNKPSLASFAGWKLEIHKGLDLCAIGTIADQLPLLGPNRSFAKYGIEALNKTERPGLLALFEEAGISSLKGRTLQARQVGTYEVNYMIAPRLNAMGRLEHALDSLRLLCTKNSAKAQELANLLEKTNKERQLMVEEIVAHAKEEAIKIEIGRPIVVYHEMYHEGVIGLVASKLVEEFWRPTIVLSKGKEKSKASARSIPGFNIIETIRKVEGFLIDGGGHPMAAGFSIETSKIEGFIKNFHQVSEPLMTDDLLTKKLKIDLEMGFSQINHEFYEKLLLLNPTGIGNPTPLFMSTSVSIVDTRTVGSTGKHLKLRLKQGKVVKDAIAFGMGELFTQLKPQMNVDITYNVEINEWNGYKNIELKLRDIKFKNYGRSI